MRAFPMPFDGGERPNVQPGDRVEVRDANGDWRGAIACSGPRYDYEQAIGGKCYLTVAVEVDRDGRGRGVRNWPAEDVRTVPA